MAAIATSTFWLFEQRRITNVQLDDIKALLKITARDTTANLDAIKGQLNLIKHGSGPVAIEKFYHYVDEISSMVQQITVLERLTGLGYQHQLLPAQLLPLLNEAIESLKGPSFEKHIVWKIDSEDFEHTMVIANKWLLCHSILENVARYTLEMSYPESTINISCRVERSVCAITFQYQGDSPEENREPDHGLFIAQKVLQIHNGGLQFEDKGPGNTVTIRLPLA